MLDLSAKVKRFIVQPRMRRPADERSMASEEVGQRHIIRRLPASDSALARRSTLGYSRSKRYGKKKEPGDKNYYDEYSQLDFPHQEYSTCFRRRLSY